MTRRSRKFRFCGRNRRPDFVDCLIGARHRPLGCTATASFDSDAVKLPGWLAYIAAEACTLIAEFLQKRGES